MKKRSQEEWRELIALQAISGQSAQVFCQEKQLCPKYFSLRKKQLGLRESASPFVRARLNTMTTLTTDEQPTATQALMFRCNKGFLYFSNLPDPEWLARWLSAMA